MNMNMKLWIKNKWDKLEFERQQNLRLAIMLVVLTVLFIIGSIWIYSKMNGS